MFRKILVLLALIFGLSIATALPAQAKEHGQNYYTNECMHVQLKLDNVSPAQARHLKLGTKISIAGHTYKLDGKPLHTYWGACKTFIREFGPVASNAVSASIKAPAASAASASHASASASTKTAPLVPAASQTPAPPPAPKKPVTAPANQPRRVTFVDVADTTAAWLTGVAAMIWHALTHHWKLLAIIVAVALVIIIGIIVFRAFQRPKLPGERPPPTDFGRDNPPHDDDRPDEEPDGPIPPPESPPAATSPKPAHEEPEQPAMSHKDALAETRARLAVFTPDPEPDGDPPATSRRARRPSTNKPPDLNGALADVSTAQNSGTNPRFHH